MKSESINKEALRSLIKEEINLQFIPVYSTLDRIRRISDDETAFLFVTSGVLALDVGRYKLGDHTVVLFKHEEEAEAFLLFERAALQALEQLKIESRSGELPSETYISSGKIWQLSKNETKRS